eukprot:TRINITY_DN46575_c0_g1_i1.p1 TRINITY_DN46575_c0_g1~~TRINITY_DN46575_c0_g1_i1.p1  ORF type:complete len:177 (-),score=39.27 TRINITY_DN46575_c0_g1_i1:45-509(-)
MEEPDAVRPLVVGADAARPLVVGADEQLAGVLDGPASVDEQAALLDKQQRGKLRRNGTLCVTESMLELYGLSDECPGCLRKDQRLRHTIACKGRFRLILGLDADADKENSPKEEGAQVDGDDKRISVASKRPQAARSVASPARVPRRTRHSMAE